MTVYVVDDGSPNYSELWKRFYREIATRLNWELISRDRVPGTNGKKKAQQAALTMHAEKKGWNKDDLILFLDADTCLEDPFLVQRLANAHKDSRVGAVSAQLGVANQDRNQVTKYLATEYELTFLQDKAAQSQHGMVMVVNGACGMWKWSAIEKVYDRYLQGPATGDENTLTWEVLQAGYSTIMLPTIAKTEVPVTLAELAIQQVRWLRSDCLYIWKNYRFLFGKRKTFLLYDMSVDLFTPLLLPLAAVGCLWFLATGSGLLAMSQLLLLLTMVSVDALVIWYSTNHKIRLSYAFWSAIQVGFYGVIRIWAILTYKQDVWVTK
jgi:cellulose synthase/poly-beta-1,6-N-acetylglucosamine synthase-like glycosyltransferase